MAIFSRLSGFLRYNTPMNTRSHSPHTLHARAVLVTGGAVRLGRATALHLARDGWHVAIHYHQSKDEALSTVAELEALGVNAACVQGDLTEGEDLEAIIQSASTALNMPLHGLVNNAAIFTKDSLTDMSRESWLSHMDTNLYAPLRLTSVFAAQLPKGQHGAVVNLIDGCEAMCLSPNFLTYSLSKYGLREATRLMAQDLAPRIRINGVSPGLTLPKDGEEAMFKRLVAKTPLRQATTPEQIAEAVAYLLNAPSITGQILAVDGGAGLISTS